MDSPERGSKWSNWGRHCHILLNIIITYMNMYDTHECFPNRHCHILLNVIITYMNIYDIWYTWIYSKRAFPYIAECIHGIYENIWYTYIPNWPCHKLPNVNYFYQIWHGNIFQIYIKHCHIPLIIYIHVHCIQNTWHTRLYTFISFEYIHS